MVGDQPQRGEGILRILFMADTPPDPDRGAAGTEVQTMRALRDAGHRVTEVWAEELGRRIGHGNLHLLLELPRAYERAAVSHMRRESFDVVHVNQPHGYRAARTTHRLWPDAVFIHRSHGFELNVNETLRPWKERLAHDDRGLLRRAASRALNPFLERHAHAIASEADGHIVSSSSDATYLSTRLGVPPDRVAVIPQGIPNSFLRHAPPPMTAERLRRLLYVGQFAFVKAPALVAASLRNLLALDPEARASWVCDRLDHPAVRQLLGEDAARRTNLLPWMPQEKLRDVYDSHGLFLFPSFYEGFGKAFLEAMSRGLCVVASDVGGMHDVIESGRTGLLVPPGNEARLTEAACSLFVAVERASSISSAAVEAARAFTWERVARGTAEFYSRVLQAKRPLVRRPPAAG